jgi:hypothetical protein
VVSTSRPHPAPAAAARLLLAAQAGQLQSVDVSAVLGAIRRMQTLDGGGDHGCLRWYWEEPRPVDKNASFFTGISLIALQCGHADQLDAAEHEALVQILKDLRTWCLAETAERGFHYPNRYLGDLVCAWLIGEIVGGANDDALRRRMLDASAYWKANGWGWGEHLSDTYAGICLDELSALLLLSNHLPDDVRVAYGGLFDDLLALDDAFGGLPRVPAIRSYAFDEPPTRVSYRDWVRPLPPGGAPLPPRVSPAMPPDAGDVFRHGPPLGATLYARGWHDLAAPRKPAATDLTIPCFGGAVATAHLAGDIRIGSLSRFPLMPGAERLKWGLAWQSFPVAFWRPQGDWGFLQWETRVGDERRAHPALDLATSYFDPALADTNDPPVVGQTYSIQSGGDVIVLRIMPAVAASWDALADRIRVINALVSPTVLPTSNGHAQMVLPYPGREVGVLCLPVSAGADVRLRIDSSGTKRTVDWGPGFNRDALGKLSKVIVLWGLSVNGRVTTNPVIFAVAPAPDVPRAPEEHPFELRWQWPGKQWRLRIAPLDPLPLRELPPA